MKQAILITGGAKRLGKAVALEFAAHGYDIALHYNHSQHEANETAAEIKALGANCRLFQADLTADQAPEQLVAKALIAFPHLAALVQCAAVFEPQPLGQITRNDYRSQMSTNFEAPLWMMQAYANQVKTGAIINFIDHFTRKHHTRFFAYLLSKKALEQATLMAAASLGPRIRVHGVSPGAILPSPGFDENFVAEHAHKSPLQRTTTPQEIAQTVRMLVETSHVTGQILTLGSGEELWW